MARPHVHGSIEQRRFAGSARSTVATACDIVPLVRLVFARIGEPSAGYSPACSFNDPSSMRRRCEGLGTVVDIGPDAGHVGQLVFPGMPASSSGTSGRERAARS
ncbi:excinuclease UvrABC ATPase subunit [Pseudoclavibacter chungangensis]|uniref:hypothetical protein n=1 Tax=Pseudoclavibacter chungangensis TaxID=587635 RepID=UPI00182BBFC0|nr:hypothetical protein [Pseudoclavibacter chungangensis]NYJ67581.1 excinuclease UvrABC ATPase subunit [Pseudoclavibacter chungangensis]